MVLPLTRLRRTGAAALGTVSIALLAACGGGGAAPEVTPIGSAQPQESSSTAAAPSESESSPAPAESDSSSTPAESDSSSAQAEPLSDQDLEAAKTRLLEFLQTADDGEWEQACQMMMTPEGRTLSDAELAGCAAGAKAEVGSDLQPGTFDSLDTSMMDAEDNGDGTATVSVGGQEFPVKLRKGPDGQMYLDSGSM
ncbi:hypothetical protein JSY14_01310 [Brachybacterium sp. EF45031]|uniref:hypothetical protein n=1 Tax=Brachybacterium sillae TaxID=2810536 RepID=UPI00217EC0CE|nr:hypothetical protein [Brachybacterium sillae]MCS6710724.1 hypothetical protein [Brachybacterium sillae]